MKLISMTKIKNPLLKALSHKMSKYIRVISPRDPIESGKVINTTSRSRTWSKMLSPFFLGPVGLYDGYIAQNVENGWQYSKAYMTHCDDLGDPTEEYFKWAKEGWNNKRAVRYPMGQGAVPLYSYWDGKKLSYTEAREEIYIPLYRQIVNTKAFEYLKMEYNSTCLKKGEILHLWDFDGYDHKELGMSYYEVLKSEFKKMGHAFVLAMLLEFGEDFTIEDLK